MAISVSSLTTGSNAFSSSATTASVSPSSGGVLCVAIMSYRSFSSPSVPSVSGLSLSWTVEKSFTFTSGGDYYRVTLAYAPSGSSPGSGTLSIDFKGSMTANYWSVFEFTGTVDTSDAFVQSAANGGTGTSGSVTLASFNDATNGVALGVFGRTGAGSVTPGSGFTEVSDANQLQVEYKVGEDTSVDASWSNASWGGIAAEVRALSVVTVTGDSGEATASGGTATPVVTVTADSGVATAAGGVAAVIGDKTVTGDAGSASADGGVATPTVAAAGDAGAASAAGGAASLAVSVAVTAGEASASGATATPTVLVTGDSGVATAGGTGATVYGAHEFGPDVLIPASLTLTGLSATSETLTGLSASPETLAGLSASSETMTGLTANSTLFPSDDGDLYPSDDGDLYPGDGPALGVL